MRRGRLGTWIALVVITVGTAGAVQLDTDADPVVQGLFATVAALEIMLGVFWWRGQGRS